MHPSSPKRGLHRQTDGITATFAISLLVEKALTRTEPKQKGALQLTLAKSPRVALVSDSFGGASGREKEQRMSTSLQELEREFHEVMLSLYDRAKAATNNDYRPVRFLQAVRRHGGLAYAK